MSYARRPANDARGGKRKAQRDGKTMKTGSHRVVVRPCVSGTTRGSSGRAINDSVVKVQAPHRAVSFVL